MVIQVGTSGESTCLDVLIKPNIYSMHLDAVSDDHPLFLRQWRRRCFAAAFVVDKSLATYLRRPPLLQSRYCVLTPPLDIDDEEDTVQSNVSVDETAEYLNEYGWNVGGVPRPITFIRLRFLLAIIREEVLDLMLVIDRQGLEEQAQSVDRSSSYLDDNIDVRCLEISCDEQQQHGMLVLSRCAIRRVYGTKIAT